MGFDKQPERCCDECKAPMHMAARIHLGKAYCRSCYSKIFIRSVCVRCQGSMREHRYTTGLSICGACLREQRTCTRCAASLVKASKIIDGKAYCWPCAVHFREASPCEKCGKVSQRLSRPLFAGISEKWCPRCRSALTHATCAHCRSYRDVAGLNEKKRPLCRSCLDNPTSSHACSQCGATLEGAGNRRCRKCLNKNSLSDLACQLNSRLSSKWVQILWSGFVESRLSIDEGAPTLKRKIIHAFEFFVLLDQKFVMQAEVTEASLIELIGSLLLRKYLLASRYIIFNLGLIDLDKVRANNVQQNRIAAIATKASGRPFQQVLDGYSELLNSKSLLARTVYGYQRTAQGLCIHAQLRAGDAIDCSDILKYLRKYPGQYACLFPFVTYCREALNWKVSMPPKKLVNGEGEALRRRVKKLSMLLADFQRLSSGARKSKMVARILSLTLNIPVTQLIKYKEQVPVDREKINGGVQVYWDACFMASDPLYPYAKLWAESSTGLT